VTTYFVGGYYELTGSTVTKYYFAGAQRVATPALAPGASVRKYTIPQSMSVEYLLGDHPSPSLRTGLGSTSLTTDANGTKVSELRYKPCPLRYTSGVLRKGEHRHTWTSAPATTPAYRLPSYTFTGQYSHMDDPSTAAVTEGFGLMFYNARWYDPALGRFAQADTIVPTGVQGLDRYAYVNNAPTRFTDPSGHRCVPVEECGTLHGDFHPVITLSKRAQDLIAFSKSVEMTPEEVIGIGLGHEMFGESEDEREIHMQAFRNGFLRYVNENCGGYQTHNCMLNYFAGSYESVYNQFLSKESGYTKPTAFWGKRDDYLFAQYAYVDSKGRVRSNLSGNNQSTVKAGVEFMGSFMDTISSYSYDPDLALNSGVVDAQALNVAVGGYPTYDRGFLIVKSVTCPNTGAVGYSLIYNLWGEKALDAAGLTDC